MKGGNLCTGKDGTRKEMEREEMSCANEKCGVDGGWGSWGGWSECSLTCGATGKQIFKAYLLIEMHKLGRSFVWLQLSLSFLCLSFVVYQIDASPST